MYHIIQLPNVAVVAQVPMVDDPHDPGVNRRQHRIEGEARFLAADEEYLFADARTHRVDRDERLPRWLSIRCERLHDQQRDAREVLVLACHDDISDDAGKLHYSLISIASMMPTMAAS